LRGYRFSDTLPDAFKSFTVIATITNDLILQPGESVILLDSLSSEVFKLWWGERHLPCGLQIFTFGGFSFSASGESLFLWNQAAMDPLDTVATVMWLASTPGVSLEVENICDTNGCVGYAIWDAVCGTNGAFRADQDGDIGSPGYLSNMPPFLTLTAQPVSLTVVRGATATFSVCADGTPERSYQWRKDGVPLAGATNASLIISNAQTADAGGYSVVVTNAADAITSQVATLTVIVPPRITAQPQSLIRRQGNDASFNVQAVGDMELTYQWQFNGINLAGANSHSLCLV
jgi:hypothetical protein